MKQNNKLINKKEEDKISEKERKYETKNKLTNKKEDRMKKRN